MQFKSIASLVAFAVGVGASLLSSQATERTLTVAFLGVQLQNDNEGLEPTTNAERARMQAIQQQFETKLQSSNGFKFVAVPPAIQKEIAAGQNIGECHGCEVEYGQKFRVDRVAWIKVQKVSNLILNMNVYMVDVPSQKMTFVHSVDIRGNTDESWTRSLAYLLDNYFTKSPS